MTAYIKNTTLRLKEDTMHYVRFGRGSRILIMLPGLGDGLATVKGTALPMALMYHAFAKDFTVYMFSRRNHLPEGWGTREMARDLKEAMDALNIPKADLVGVSMGGMIAQHFAADYPERTGKLVLVVSCAKANAVLSEAIDEWLEMARRGDHTDLMDSNVRRMYSDAYYRKNSWLIPVAGKFTKPRSYERFFIQANACLTHNAQDRIGLITAPTLVIGGKQDRVLGPNAPHELAAAIPGAQLKIYEEWGHGLYDEAKDFNLAVLSFLLHG